MAQLQVTGLPARQAEAFLHAANGLTRKEAAKAMGCSPQNAAQLVHSVLFKLRARNTPEAIAIAFQRGVLRVMTLVMIVGALGPFGPAEPAQADEDDPLARRIRSRPRGPGTRRVRGGRIPRLSRRDQQFLNFYDLEPVLLWDDGDLYISYQ